VHVHPRLQANYPERLHKLYIIHASWAFQGVYSVLRHLLDPVLQDKVRQGVNAFDGRASSNGCTSAARAKNLLTWDFHIAP
jgi:hypothetical protein